MGSTQSTWGSLLLPVTASQLFNMKSMILIAVFLAVAAAAPQDNRPILIVKQSQNHDTEKQVYSFSYETENGIVVGESGVQKQIGAKPEESGTVSQAATLSPKIARDTPSPGWPMRTDSRPREIICPLLPLCPSTSSRCSTT